MVWISLVIFLLVACVSEFISTTPKFHKKTGSKRNVGPAVANLDFIIHNPDELWCCPI
jgi:hypothetical protein